MMSEIFVHLMSGPKSAKIGHDPLLVPLMICGSYPLDTVVAGCW